ncbi:hypothetical protein UMM65_07550 [Aureibaculum sp. 2210JD6-5]|uniref:FKBP-type peptidyl-prolyl cis-trans isomerase n=1 Tax=Aureibaculum sp. 2210JD6-5 TaxID=3103957 RepID=UPI002AACE119|nr:FKBP-type peptidyl-prolyl cis-trans isomerase [Aureibaculum sp. 2210JD6-5]MDY7395092.1 hypothetical protein [Aureibaculum sp. 2210JD6-5]
MKLNLNTIFCILLLGLILVSCKKDKDDGEPHDPVAQALIDDDKLVDYLQTHYYIPPEDGESFGVIDTILSGEESLYLQVETKNLTYNEIDYKLYYYEHENSEEGINPSRTDSVLVRYSGFLLDSTRFDHKTDFIWFGLSSAGLRVGWNYGLPFFKDGMNISETGEPLKFQNTGKGVIFFPSGLGYEDIGQGVIGPNEPLVFHIELGLVKRTDSDSDGIYNLYEDIDGDGSVFNDDTDEDGTADFIDTDDDGDGKLTKDENADPNGDGNPNDALDSDNDGTPDYLDADS